MDALAYSTVHFKKTDYQQISQQLSLQSQRQIRVKVQTFMCAHIPRNLDPLAKKLEEENHISTEQSQKWLCVLESLWAFSRAIPCKGSALHITD